MYQVIKSVIQSGGYKLGDIQRKVKKLHLLGDLTEAQMDELLMLSRQGAESEAERPEVLIMLRSLSSRVDALAAEVAALKGGGEEAGGYAPWEGWDGISDRYRVGSIVTHGGKLWISVYPGQNVWEPGAVGSEFWEEYREG